MVKKGLGKISKGPIRNQRSTNTITPASYLAGLDNNMEASIGFGTSMPEGMRDMQDIQSPSFDQTPENPEVVQDAQAGPEGPNLDQMEPMEKLAQPIYGPDPTFRKEKILKYVDAVDKFRRKESALTYMKKIQELTDIMMHVYKLIRDENYANEEEKNELSHRNSKIAEEKRTLEKKYQELMDSKFADFKDSYKNIYDLAISEQGLNRITLNHVLNTYSDYQKGKISHNAGTNIGLRFEKTRANLPDDFFTYLPE